MSREKQIDIPESEMGMSGYSKFSWKLWEEGLCNMSEAQRADQIMREQGYRRASDVAEEIFVEIEASAKVKYWRGGGLVVFEVNGEDFAELKKKYTEDKGRDKIAEFGKYSPLSWRNTEN